MLLPCHMFDTTYVLLDDIPSRWIRRVMAEANRVAAAPGWNPKMVHLEGSVHMIDMSMRPDSKMPLPASIIVIAYEDHPFLKELEPRVPRAVKSLYRKEVRLKHLRAGDSWTILEDVDRAEEAWEEYIMT